MVQLRQCCGVTGVFGGSQLAWLKPDTEFVCEGIGYFCLNDIQIRHVTQQISKVGDALARRCNGLVAQFFRRDAQHPQHFFDVELHQQCSLKHQRIAIERAASARNFFAVHLNIIARAELRLHPQAAHAARRRFADTA